MNHIKLMLACCGCLVFAQTAAAQMFTDLSATIKTQPISEDCDGVPCPPIDCGADPLNLDVCNVSANFDDVFPNIKMLSVTVSDVQAEAPFFQNPLGVDTSPPCAFIPVFPDLQCDTFVTMNRKNTCPGDATNTDPAFAFGADTVTGGWFNSDPTNDQGHPQPTGDPGANQVLLAQFAVPSGANVSGLLEVSWQAPDGGPVQFNKAIFECVSGGPDCATMPGLCDPDCEFCDLSQPSGTEGCMPLPLSTACDNDGDLCTGEHCDGQGNCIPFPDGDVMCQDPVPPCEGGEQCDPGTGECVALPDAPLSTACDNDGDLCTGEHCDGAGNCVDFPDGDVMCQDPVPPCEGGEECDPGTGECVALADAPLSTTCDNDGDLCTGEHCDGAGNCVDFPDSDVTCQDPVPPCEGGEQCDPGTGECLPLADAPLSTACDNDGDLCTGEHCDGQGNCVDFPDGDVMCQDPLPPCEGGEQCDPASGECVAMPDAPASTLCEADGDLCTNDHCDGAGACVFLSDVVCQDPVPPCEGGEQCEPATGECVALPDAPLSTACDNDGDLCTGDHCDGKGNCLDFPDGDVMCQDPVPPCEGGEQCEPATGECVTLPDAPASTDCELDGDLCSGEHCDGAGNCVDFPDGDVMCQDPVPPCEGGEQCDPASGECVAMPDAPASTLCESDGDLCTNDHCDGAGACVFLSDVVCQDPVPPCEGGEQCDPGSGVCMPLADAPASTDCELDGDLCSGEHCDGAGNCVDFPDGDVICQDPVPPCEGGEMCDPASGNCVAQPDAAASTLCEADGDLCTNDHCDGMGSCVFLSDVMCQFPNPPCEGGEQCNPTTGECEALPDAPLSTDCELDGNLCSGEHCDGAGNCVDFPDGDVSCQDAVPPCEGGEQCNPMSGECEALPDAPMSTACELDGDLCSGEHCDGAGNCVDFPDGDVICQDPLPPCEGGEQCDPATGVCVAMPDAPASTLCEADGDLCTNDHCDGAGMCILLSLVECPKGEVCDPVTGECVPVPPCTVPGPAPVECNDNNDCTDDICTVDLVCENVPVADGTVCGDQSTTQCDAPDSCLMGVCVPNFVAVSTTCDNDGDLCTGEHCDGAGNCADFPAGDVLCADPLPPCEGGEQCDPATGACVPLADASASTICELDGDLCTGEHCDGAGNCVDFPDGDVVCQGAVPPCEGGEQCDPATGMCVPLPDAPLSTECEADGNLCTIDHCDGAGSCILLSEVMCQPPIAPCESGSECDPATGMCVDLPDAAMSTACELDGDLCTGEHCDGMGACVDYPDGDVFCPPGETCDPGSGQCVPVGGANRTLIIKQGACPAPLNPNSNGVLPTVLAGDFDFDVLDVDLGSLQLCRCDGVGGCVAPINGPPGPQIKFQDLNHPFEDPACGTCSCNANQDPDGITDIKMKFSVSELAEVLQLNSVPGGGVVGLELTGQLSDGSTFSATDCVSIRPPGPALPSNVKVESNVLGTFIELAPADLLVDDDGFTNFVRFYDDGTQLTLTAPLVSADGLNFVYWVVNGVSQPLGQRTIEVTVQGRRYLDVVYRPGQVLQPENLPGGFQSPDGSFGSDGTP